MAYKFLKLIQLIVTGLIIGMAVYCFISKRELYPFAPYSMYSQKHEIRGLKFFRFYCRDNKREVLLTNLMIRPLDEARLAVGIEKDYLNNESRTEIIKKLNSLKLIVRSNGHGCDLVLLKIKEFKDAKDYQQEAGKVFEEIQSERSL